MAALTQDRDTRKRVDAELYTLGVEAATTIYAGALVCLNAAGNAVPGSTAIGLIALGRARCQANNAAGAAGAINVDIERGVFRWDNSAAGDAITEENIGQNCYVVDDHTVALTSGPGTRSIAGKIFDVDSQGVWVDTRKPDAPKTHYLTLAIADLKAADASVYHIASPVKGRITKLLHILEAAIVTADATLTGKIGAAAITNGVVDIVQAASAAGQVNTATPTAANAVDVGSDINFTVGGGATTVVAGTLVIEITE